LANKIARPKSNISLIIDESATLSKKSTLIMCIQICVTDSGMSSLMNWFLVLIRHLSVIATGIFDSLLNCIQLYGMMES
jgi:hypothetical protein